MYLEGSFRYMANSISYKQNLSEPLNCLAAQRTLYSKAKQLSLTQILLSVPLIIVIAIITMVFNDKSLSQKIGVQQIDISWIAAFVGVSVALFDLFVITPAINTLKDKAAKIQELFDTSVFQLPWNGVAAGRMPDHEEIIKYSRRIRENPEEINKLKNWYSDKLDSMPLSISTIMCQRSNLWWDLDLRNYYSNIITFVAFILFFILLCIGLYDELTLKKFFLVVLAPALPIIIFAARQRIDNRNAINQLTYLKDLLNTGWNEILSMDLSDDDILGLARKLQDQIYLNRKNNPLIFDWIYELRKSKQHESMFYSIDQMITEYENRTHT
jgi:hypothetical protein